MNLELDKVAERLKHKRIEIQVPLVLKNLLVEKGFDQNLGARPLKRVIQKLVLDPFSMKIVTQEIKEGDRVVIDVKKGEVVFNVHAGKNSKQKNSVKN